MSVSVKIHPDSGSSLVRLSDVALAPRSASLRRPGGRTYSVATQNRYNSDWKYGSNGINSNLRVLRTVRDMARDQVDNDDYARGYIRQIKTNIVGPYGFSWHINPRNQDEKFRSNVRRIEDKFARWCESEYCTITQEHEFLDVQLMNIVGAARDGEFLIRIIRDKRLRFGFTQQIIPIELLDETYIGVLPGNRIVILGVEYDRTTMRRLAYWLRDVPAEYQMYGLASGSGRRIRIPAEEIIHGFDSEYGNQARGISWMVQTLSSMRHLSRYEDAMLLAARMRAMIGGFIEMKGDLPADYEGDSEDEDGNQIMELENGIWKTLPPGMKASYSDNDFPGAQYGPFTDHKLRRQSAGLGVAGSVHSGNYSDVNFSSEKARQIAVRDNYMLGQQWYIRKYFKPIGKIFMREAYLTGEIYYPMSQEDAYLQHVWTGRRWAYVNPEQEMNANAMKWTMRTKSISEMIGEGDGALERDEVFAQIADDIKAAAKYGIEIKADIKQPTATVEPGAPAAPAPVEPAKKPKKQQTEGDANA